MKKDHIDKFPLTWPDGQATTAGGDRKSAAFKLSFAAARDHAIGELERMGVGDWDVIISSNIELRRDGLPYSGRKPAGSPGVAVYFQFEGEQQVFACDCWDLAEDNMRAIGKTIEALRGIQRWGSTEMMRRAFGGFKALPPGYTDWRHIFGFDPDELVSATALKRRYHERARLAHPDLHGGDNGELTRLNLAHAAAKEAIASVELATTKAVRL